MTFLYFYGYFSKKLPVNIILLHSLLKYLIAFTFSRLRLLLDNGVGLFLCGKPILVVIMLSIHVEATLLILSNMMQAPIVYCPGKFLYRNASRPLVSMDIPGTKPRP